MFSLIRRISGSVIPRPDRPWDEDATSNAPKIGRKRRLSDDDDDGDENNKTKKAKGEGIVTAGVDQTESGPATPLPQPETREVKEVTKGVKDVELQDKEVEPESVPLPEEDKDDLDAEGDSTKSTPPPAEPADEVPSASDDKTESSVTAAADAPGHAREEAPAPEKADSPPVPTESPRKDDEPAAGQDTKVVDLTDVHPKAPKKKKQTRKNAQASKEAAQ